MPKTIPTSSLAPSRPAIRSSARPPPARPRSPVSTWAAPQVPGSRHTREAAPHQPTGRRLGQAAQTTAPSRTAITYLRVSTKEQAERGGRDEGSRSPPSARPTPARPRPSMRSSSPSSRTPGSWDVRVPASRAAEDARLRARAPRRLLHRPQARPARPVPRRRRRHRLRPHPGRGHLVSVSENIDETPSGMLMHGIMSSIAEFYSRNLANEVTKGMVQKANLGGTVTRAPLGYKTSDLTDDPRRINRTVQVDPERPTSSPGRSTATPKATAPSILLEQLHRRGPDDPAHPEIARTAADHHHPAQRCTTPSTRVRSATRACVTTVPRAPRRPGDLAAGPGPARRRQHRRTHQRTNLHYLRGSVYCGGCGSRLMLTTARTGPPSTPTSSAPDEPVKTTSCQRQAMPVDLVEELIEEEYLTIALSPDLRTASRNSSSKTSTPSRRPPLPGAGPRNPAAPP